MHVYLHPRRARRRLDVVVVSSCGVQQFVLSQMPAAHLDSPEVVPPVVTIAIPLWIIIASLLRRGESDKGGPRGGGQPDQRYGLEAVVVPSTARLQRAHHRLFSLWHASC